MRTPKYKLVELVSTCSIVEIEGGRREEIHQSVIDKRWYATFNGLHQSFTSESAALQYALTGKFTA